MNPPTSLSRRILQTADIDAFTALPESSLSPITAAATPAAPRRPFIPTSPFDSSMALTILVLLTALFFLGFFSVYIRRFSADSPGNSPPPAPRHRAKGGGGGLDASAVDSLPLVAYGGAATHPMIDECPICLTEFREKETVRLIPRCGHVFHPCCLDTWLASHVTCPLCRSAELFRVEEVRLSVAPDKNGEGSTWRDGDTWRCGGAAGVRRTCSCSDVAHRAVLQRSTSF